jgi:hypothetical protein
VVVGCCEQGFVVGGAGGGRGWRSHPQMILQTHPMRRNASTNWSTPMIMADGLFAIKPVPW